MNEVCLDANVVVKLVLEGEQHRESARKLIEHSIRSKTKMIAPPVFESELDSILRKRVYHGLMRSETAHLAYTILDTVQIRTMNHLHLRRRSREIAERFNQRLVYDSTYAALAELMECEFWTADEEYYRRVTPELTFVRYLPEFRG